MNSQEKIREMSAAAKRVMPSNGEAYLFGSQARGTANENSDWDILILLDKDRITHEDYLLYGYPFLELGWDIDAMISPILYTKKDWEKRSFIPFYKNVMRDRIRL
jgi:predicted nucleotidyltransferase